MISGWSKLQLPLGVDTHGRGVFTPPSPSIASRPSLKEQGFFLCRSHGDPGGIGPHNDSFRATLVENLIGALINATEILDDYGHPSDVPDAVKRLLGFEASSQDQDLALASHSLLDSEPVELLFHERLSRGSSAHTSVSPPVDNVVSMSYHSQQQAHAHHAVQASSAFHSGGFSHGQRELSVNAIHSTDHEHRNSHNSSTEEDFLLQEARSRAFRRRMEPDEVKSSSQTGISSHGPGKMVDAVPPDSKQAKNVSCGLAKNIEVLAETENAWPFTEITRTSQQNILFWGWITMGMLMTGALLVICRSTFSLGRQSQRPSVKRRILKSQWYGNPGSQLWEHKNFQMRIAEFPKYPLLEVDGDKKLLRFTSESAGMSTAKRSSQPSERTQTFQKQPIRQTLHGTGVSHTSSVNKVQGRPIRQSIHDSRALPREQHQSNDVSNGRTSAAQLPEAVSGLRKAAEEERKRVLSQPRVAGFHGRRVVKDDMSKQGISRVTNQGHWGKDDELDLDRRIHQLYQTIQAVEQHRREAMIALEEERQRSLALEEEMSKQREVAALLGEEVRLLKDSHSALLTSLQKKYSTMAAARTAADLVYQDWERHVAAD